MEPVRIVPMGGLGEFGLNMMLIEYGDDAIAVDCGLMFPDAHLLRGRSSPVHLWILLFLEAPRRIARILVLTAMG